MSLTQQWLRQHVQPYPAANRVFADIDAALVRCPTLRPKSDVFTFDDGRSQLLLCVHGLLPIAYRGVSYNIPMAFWITRDYPRHPPIAYVVPTNNILVRAGKHVDVSGRCCSDYIQNWERKDEGCSLSALLESLQQLFSNDPPVYSKQKEDDPPPSDAARPPLPNKPMMRPPTVDPNRMTNPAPSPPALTLPVGPALPPQLPPRLGQAWTVPSPNYSSVVPLSSGPHFHRVNESSGQPPLPAPPTIPAVSKPPPVPRLSKSYPPGSSTIPVPDFLDQDDPVASHAISLAPPRPPNPELLMLHAHVHEKLLSELNSLTQALVHDAERLRAHQADLSVGEPAVKDEMARLQAVRDVCRSVAQRTGQAVQTAETNIAELRRKGDPEVDELVCATTIVHNQLINLIADDNAIEDTIYHLHRALNVGRIDLDRFLRSTRILAEEQFMKRALIEKILSSVPSSSISPDWI